MGGKFSKDKGKRGEREVVNLLQPVIDAAYATAGGGVEVPKLYRDQNQSARGGYDLRGIDWFAPEVKYQEQLNVNLWWNQTLSQVNEGQMPVLIYRKSRMKWRVRMIGSIGTGSAGIKTVVDITLEDFQKFLYRKICDNLISGYFDR